MSDHAHEVIEGTAVPPLYPTQERFHVEVQQHHGAWWTNVPSRRTLAAAEAELPAEVRAGRRGAAGPRAADVHGRSLTCP